MFSLYGVQYGTGIVKLTECLTMIILQFVASTKKINEIKLKHFFPIKLMMMRKKMHLPIYRYAPVPMNEPFYE